MHPFIKLGDRIRSLDFEPREGHEPSFIEGVVVGLRRWESGYDYDHYVVLVDRDVHCGKDELARVGAKVQVPLETSFDYPGRITVR